MYEELLNFLLARKKRLLSEEEADKLMQLIAQSMEIEDGQREKEDNTALIKKILDNVDVDKIIEEDSESMEDAIDDLFFNDYSNEDCSDDIIDLCESDYAGESLSERKFQRGVFRTKGGSDVASEAPKRKIGIKTRKSDTEGLNEEDVMIDKHGGAPKDEVNGGMKALETRCFKLPGSDTNGSHLGSNEERRKGSDLLESSEFQFDLGDLKRVDNTGPDVKFFDEDGKEL
ncbi:hypothetical protein EROM_081060 [Encephalitozoon romaleae SJ-2008]|uniref:Uncharacterized protein n=1 Tax=Encephalitozoon romaleae (strain SJ-2008) TaxID=1178016 RepID=I7ASU9_ENCRO|nr:hypothetical protein EROM_081060 [Encephalitozoon romaleae SJ-2008]AFN83522.1 hypothetical protein EROM_081060 [Encephalitozoon romaleae SJ-2008]